MHQYTEESLPPVIRASARLNSTLLLPFQVLTEKELKSLKRRFRKRSPESLREAIGITLQNQFLEDHHLWSMLSEFTAPHRRRLTQWYVLFLILGLQKDNPELAEASARFISEQLPKLVKRKSHFWLLLIMSNAPIGVGAFVVLDHIKVRSIKAGMDALFQLDTPFGAGAVASVLVKPPALQKKKSIEKTRGILPNLLRNTSTLGLGEIGPGEQESIAKLVENVNAQDEIALLAIDALHCVGGGKILPILNGAVSKNLHPDVRSALQNLIPVIQERADREEASGVLLRPSSEPARMDLLRPASYESGSKDHLLRPADPVQISAGVESGSCPPVER